MNNTNQNSDDGFWSQYDIPIEHGTCIKVRRSGLLRGSSGTGRAKDTVVHFHVIEAFRDGRLSRGADSYLCENDSHVFPNAQEEERTGDDEQDVQAITCDTCLKRMERWEVDDGEV